MTAGRLSIALLGTLVKGLVTGPVHLDSGSKLDLGDYQSNYKLKKEFTVVADTPETELELVRDRCSPKFVQLELSPPRTEAVRRSLKR